MPRFVVAKSFSSFIIIYHISRICINLNGKLHFSLGLLSFDGACRNGSGKYLVLGSEVSSSPMDCQQKCKHTNGCTAFGYVDGFEGKNCDKYGGGPYTSGDGHPGYSCYIMPGMHIS